MPIKVYVLVVVTLFFPAYAYIPFNPIIKAGGDPLRWQGKHRQGIVGWIDVPDHRDRVLALKMGDANYAYIHPQNPDIELPKGLFVWYKSLQTKYPAFKDLKQHAQECTTLWKALKPSHLDYWLQVEPEKFFFGMRQGVFQKQNGQVYDPARPGLASHPSPAVHNFFQWTPEEAKHHLLDRLFFIHAVLGVTEEYFRDFFGGTGVMPTVQDINTYFPVDNPHFPERNVIAQSIGALEVASLGQLHDKLSKKTPNSPQRGTGFVKLIDGYQRYLDAGGKLPTDAEKNRMKKDVYLQARFLDSPAAHEARHYTDVRRLMAEPEYNDGVFQDAATQYLLEGGVAHRPNLLTGMLHGPVQGEEVPIATAGRSFALKYFEPVYDIFADFMAEYIETHWLESQ